MMLLKKGLLIVLFVMIIIMLPAGALPDSAAYFHPSTNYWYFDYNFNGIPDNSFMYGSSTDQIIAGDWDGDTKDGIAVFRPSTGYWYFDYNLDGVIDKSFRYGGNTDKIIVGDWDGDGKDGIAIFRPSTGYWYFDYTLDGVVDKSFRFGGSTDTIIKGDWDGDGNDGIAIFRPSTGYWYFDNNLDGVVDKSFRYGGSTDQIIAGKWQGIQEGIAIFRPSTGYWYFDNNLDGVVDQSFRYGGSTDKILAGDWNGDGSDGIAIFRPSTGYWYFDNNLDGTIDVSERFGGSEDTPIVGKWELPPDGYNYDFSSIPSTPTAANAASLQRSMGYYSSKYFTNGQASDAFHSMARRSIFNFNGHGIINQYGEYGGGISFDNPDGSSNGIIYGINPGNGDAIRDGPDLSRVLLVVYNGCYTSLLGGRSGNLAMETSAKGADNVIGFHGLVSVGKGNYWSDDFWQRASSGESVGTAAINARYDTIWYNYPWGFAQGIDTLDIYGVNPETSHLQPARYGTI